MNKIYLNHSLYQEDIKWMRYALILASKAQSNGDVPVGAIVIFDNRIIGSGFNCSILNHDPTAHAEIIALRESGKILKNYRICNATLYVTLEPCIMCLGAIIHSRINRLVLGTPHQKNLINKIYNTTTIFNKLKKKIQVDEFFDFHHCSHIIKNFFKFKRI